MDNNTLYKRANIWLAAFLFIFSFRHYLNLAAKHNISINLEARDLRKEYKEGRYKPEMRDSLETASEKGKELRYALLKSFLAVFITLVFALLIASLRGSLNPSLPVFWEKILALFAAFLLMWSTLFELGWGLRTWRGEALHELVHSLLFRIIFISGSFLIMISLLI